MNQTSKGLIGSISPSSLSATLLLTVSGLGLALVTSGCGNLKQKATQSAVASAGPEARSEDQTMEVTGVMRIRQPVPVTETRAVANLFYVVDTAEIYYQAALTYELLGFSDICLTGGHAFNGVAFVNSHVTETGKVLLCKAGALTELAVDQIPSLKEKMEIVASDDFDPTLKNLPPQVRDLFDPRLALQHGPDLNRYYKTYPLAHPEILATIFTYAMTELFPSDQYVYVINPKSHGSEGLVLTGLTDDMLKKKSAYQLQALEQDKLQVVPYIRYGKAGRFVSAELLREIDKLGLGQIAPPSTRAISVGKASGGLNASDLITRLNVNDLITRLNASDLVTHLNVNDPKSRLNNSNSRDYLNHSDRKDFLNQRDVRDFLNQNDPGARLNAADLVTSLNAADFVTRLNVNDARTRLQANNTFGVFDEQFFTAIARARSAAKAASGSDALVVALLLESCESNLFAGSGTKAVGYLAGIRPYSIYSAQGSLRMRNFDYNNVFGEWLSQEQPSAASLQAILRQLTFNEAVSVGR